MFSKLYVSDNLAVLENTAISRFPSTKEQKMIYKYESKTLIGGIVIQI